MLLEPLMTFLGIKLWSHYILKYNHKIICIEGHAYTVLNMKLSQRKMLASKIYINASINVLWGTFSLGWDKL